MTPAWRTSRIGEIGGSFLLICRRVIAHWRPIILLLILALATFLIAHADFFGLSLFARTSFLSTRLTTGAPPKKH